MIHDHKINSVRVVCLSTIALALLFATATVNGDDGVFVRFKLFKPADAKTRYFVRLGGYIHKTPWYLPRGVWPEGADKDADKRIADGAFTPWLDVTKFADGRLHGAMNRAGGVAEFPNMTADFVIERKAEQLSVAIELATAPRDDAVVRRWQETLTGTLTSFLVSPNLARDADRLETAAEMTARRLKWARESTGGRRNSPKSLIVQTSFWSPQGRELNLREAEVLHQLGFNVVGNQMPEVREKFKFVSPGHTHSVKFGPAATQTEIDATMKSHAERFAKQTSLHRASNGSHARQSVAASPSSLPIPFGLADEVCCRPAIGDNATARAHFHAWLAEQNIAARDLGVARLIDVVPIETPDVLNQRAKQNGPAARRVFYYTSRFRQHAATQRVRWHTDAFHKHLGTKQPVLTSTLVADHPYFAGSGLGMGMTPNPAWSGHPLAMDWFDLARRRAVDLAGIEDWMGLQYMYGPNWTWEGFQLMGFQASIFRSGSRGRQPTIAWITPSDETNMRLKTASALCQGTKHFFYWTYGPTATSTENYWSDLRGAYDGVAAVTRHLAAAEHIIAPGRPRSTRVALLYSISSDLWQPFGYVHMLERRGTYFSLIHDQYLVDMLTEEDIAAGRLSDYDVLYATDPCIARTAAARIRDWVTSGGHLYSTTAAGSRDEFNEPSELLAKTFGIAPKLEVQTQPGRYHIRGALNGMNYLDTIKVGRIANPSNEAAATPDLSLGAIGTKARFTATTARVLARFSDDSAAIVENASGKGRARYIGTCPAIAYIKEAKFVANALQEKWPGNVREFINGVAGQRDVARLVELSHPVVEAGVYDTDGGTALVLANFTYQTIQRLSVRLPVSHPVKSVNSVESGPLKFTTERSTSPNFTTTIKFEAPLKLTDIILLE